MLRVIQLLVGLTAPAGRVQDLVDALHGSMRAAQQARGCSFAQVYLCANDDRKIDYVEEWNDAAELRGQFGSERFVRLLELLEMSAERPVVKFRIIAETHGLEFIDGTGGRESTIPKEPIA